MSRSILPTAAALAAAIAIPAAPALAQTDEGDRADRSAITVIAPSVHVETERRPGSIIPERKLTASAVVYYDDLNLNTESGRDELKDRVELAAEETCEWLGEIYPSPAIGLTNEDECAFDAVKRADDQIDAAIAAYDSDRFAG